MNHEKTTCLEARMQFALLLYGELSFDEEERIETHLDGCAECRAALDREKALHAAFDGIAIEPPPSLLRECRAALTEQLNREDGRTEKAGWWERFTESLTFSPSAILRPAGALALVALGFFGAKTTPFLNLGAMGQTQASMSRVRDVQPGANGQVQIVLDETRQRVVSGDLRDRQVLSLLMDAVRDPSDPGLRAETVDLFNRSGQTPEIRDALIYTLENDQNTGVRFKAMDGLKAFAQQPEVRSALSQTVLSDANPGIRTQAIDLLIQGGGQNLDRQVIGTLQQLMLREDNAGLRQRCQMVLTSFNASPGIY